MNNIPENAKPYEFDNEKFIEAKLACRAAQLNDKVKLLIEEGKAVPNAIILGKNQSDLDGRIVKAWWGDLTIRINWLEENNEAVFITL